MTEEQKQIIRELIHELDDAVDFMDTLTDFEDETGYERRIEKIKLINKATTAFESCLGKINTLW